MTKFTPSEILTFEEILNEAVVAGNKKVSELQIKPMVVGQSKSLFSNEIDYSKPTYVVDDGPCGFAQVKLKPATNKFVKYLIEKDIASKDSYEGGAYIWISEFDQSMMKKEAYARGFAEVIRKYNDTLKLKSISATSRLD